MMKFIKRFYLAIVLFFLYVPIGVLILQSFNAGSSRAKWEGFSFTWYAKLFRDPDIMQALWVTVSIAVLAALFATIIGTLAAIGVKKDLLDSTIRLSFGAYTTEEQIDWTLEKLSEILPGLRRFWRH